METKKCLWCEVLMFRTRQSDSEWRDKRTCSNSCASFYKHHHKPKREVPTKENGQPCCYCSKPMIRKEKEPAQSWLKKRFCCKSCAAHARGGSRQDNFKKIVEKSEEEKLGVKRYIKGTPEFDRIASLYC